MHHITLLNCRVIDIFWNLSVRSGLSHHAFIEGMMESFNYSSESFGYKNEATAWGKAFITADSNYTIAKMNCER